MPASHTEEGSRKEQRKEGVSRGKAPAGEEIKEAGQDGERRKCKGQGIQERYKLGDDMKEAGKKGEWRRKNSEINKKIKMEGRKQHSLPICGLGGYVPMDNLFDFSLTVGPPSSDSTIRKVPLLKG